MAFPAPSSMHLVSFGALMVGWLSFVVSMFAGGAQTVANGETKTRRNAGSLIGIALQGLAFAVAWFGVMRFRLGPPSTTDIAIAVATLVLALSSVALFVWAKTTMGRSWSLVARTGDTLRLVTEGPFAFVRHPIYVALFGMLLATALGLQHVSMLAIAIPIYALGTAQRIAIEEKLLRAQFGDAYAAYALRVKRLVPGVF